MQQCDLTVLICSANLGNAEPSLEDLASWIPIHGQCGHMTPHNHYYNNHHNHNHNQTIMGSPNDHRSDDGDCFDLIAIGMQEATWNASSTTTDGGDSSSHKKKKKNKTKKDKKNKSKSKSKVFEENNESEEEPITELQDEGGDDKDDEEDNDNHYSTTSKFTKTDIATNASNTSTTTTSSNVKGDSARLYALLQLILGSFYIPVAEKQRGQMRLVIFAHVDRVFPHVSDITILCENTGVAGVLANKGGIVIGFTYRQSTRISFCSCHLAAHEGDFYYEQRCHDLMEILNATALMSNSNSNQHNHNPNKPMSQHSQPPQQQQQQHHMSLPQQCIDVTLSSHHMFLLGDLNFRTRFSKVAESSNKDAPGGASSTSSSSSPVAQAFELIRQGDFATLYYQHDELYAGLTKGDLLVEFQETMPCLFPPTFKVFRGVPGIVYKGKRTPSYTDRILYRSACPELLTPLAYEPCLNFTSSDHKPVRGAFALTSNALANQILAVEQRQQQIYYDEGTGPCSYNLTFRNMSCTNLPAMDLMTWSSDPYIMITWNHIRMFANHKSKGAGMLMKWSPGSNNSWPRTNYKARTLNPVFEGAEIGLTFNSGGGEAGGTLHPIVGKEAMLYVTVMDFDMVNRDDWIGTLALNLDQLLMEAADHHNKATKESADFKIVTPLELNHCPLLKNGKYCGGFVNLTIDVEKCDYPVPMPMVANQQQSPQPWLRQGRGQRPGVSSSSPSVASKTMTSTVHVGSKLARQLSQQPYQLLKRGKSFWTSSRGSRRSAPSAAAGATTPTRTTMTTRARSFHTPMMTPSSATARSKDWAIYRSVHNTNNNNNNNNNNNSPLERRSWTKSLPHSRYKQPQQQRKAQSHTTLLHNDMNNKALSLSASSISLSSASSTYKKKTRKAFSLFGRKASF
ncbi:hypothetical protein ACA910_012544 [Epithemia clementina (nom. ined.)]